MSKSPTGVATSNGSINSDSISILLATKGDIYDKVERGSINGLRNSGALPISRVDILGGRITELRVYTCGHETQPPEERGVSTDNVLSM